MHTNTSLFSAVISLLFTVGGFATGIWIFQSVIIPLFYLFPQLLAARLFSDFFKGISFFRIIQAYVLLRLLMGLIPTLPFFLIVKYFLSSYLPFCIIGAFIGFGYQLILILLFKDDFPQRIRDQAFAAALIEKQSHNE